MIQYSHKIGQNPSFCSGDMVQKICFGQNKTSGVIFKIRSMSSNLQASMSQQAGLSITWSQTLKKGFLVTWLICTIATQYKQ